MTRREWAGLAALVAILAMIMLLELSFLAS